MADEQDPTPKRRRDTILPERIMRRVLEGVGDVVDRKLGRTIDPRTGLTTDQLIQRMNRMIEKSIQAAGAEGDENKAGGDRKPNEHPVLAVEAKKGKVLDQKVQRPRAPHFPRQTQD